MRDWINLIEAEGQFDEKLDWAYEIISGYVSHGEITQNRRQHFDDQFKELMTLVPRPTNVGTLYRFLRLSDEQLAALKAGGFTLEMRNFSSWTKSHYAAELIAKKKRGEGHGVIVTAKFPARDIVIDVEGFYVEHHYTSGDFDEFGRYVKPEKEVIVMHPAPIRLTPQNTEILDAVNGSATHDAPMIGDTFFWGEPEDGQGYEIDDVDHDQPYADRGVFYVNSDAAGTEGSRAVHNIGPGEWAFIEVET